MNSAYPLRVGLFSIGLDTYWTQFENLRDKLLGYNKRIAERLSASGLVLENLGLIDTPEQAMEAGHRFRAADVSLIFLHVSTYALSATVLPVVRRARCPVILLNLVPGAAIDYNSFNRLDDRTRMTGEWLAWCQACPVPEIANVFRRAGVPFFQVTGILEDDEISAKEIEEWLAAARVAHCLEHNRLGLLGHYYSGMLDIYTDITAQCSTFGGHVEMIEADELSALRTQCATSAVAERVSQFRAIFDVQSDCPLDELERAALTSVALDQLAARHRLGSLAYYYRGAGNAANEDTMSSIILGASLLTAGGIPVAGEYEVKNANAMKIMDAFGVGGSFSEFYATDFNDDVILLGHDGPGHPTIAEGKVKVRPLGVYHGKVGRGLSVEMSVRNGPVTLLSIAEGTNGLRLIVAEGETVPGPILQIGNTNSRYRFPIGVRRFLNDWSAAGPAHHCAVGIGHIAGKLKKLAALTNVEMIRVC